MWSERMLFPEGDLEHMHTVYEVLLNSKRLFGSRDAYRQIEYNGEETAITYSEFVDKVNCIRAGLLQSGMSGKHFALIGETSIEWLSLFLAIICGVGTCVSIDKELGEESMAFQLNLSDADFVFTTEKYAEKVNKVLNRCPNINTVGIIRGDYSNFSLDFSLENLEKTGEASIASGVQCLDLVKIGPDDPCLIIFTSGTTGAHKGVLLSNRNIMSSLRGCDRLLRIPEVSFSVLPVNHSYELSANIIYCLYCGSSVCINDEPRYILKNLKRFRPELCCVVPMILDTIVSQIKREIKRSGKQAKFENTIKLSNMLRKIGIDKRRLLFEDILDFLGGSLRMIVCGGAMLNQDAADYLTSIGIDVFNGYGITECSPLIAVNSVKLIKRGSVGRILPTIEVRIDSPDENGNGEIQIRGDSVMCGYYKAERDTSQVFTEDGWFKTGDIGYKDRDEYLYINGRIKNLIILPNGKNVFPEEIEGALMKRTPCIKECVVVENRTHTGLYAHIYPDQGCCRENKLIDSHEIESHIRKVIDQYNLSEPSYKQVNGFRICETAFEKNSAKKILRHKINCV